MANLGNLDGQHPINENVDETANATVRTVYIEVERYSHWVGKDTNNSDGSLEAVHYKPTRKRPEQIAEHKAVNKRRKKHC